MKAIENYDDIAASSGEFAKPGNGGYILEIVAVEDVPIDPKTGKGDYLRISYDIAEGEFKGYYKAQNERFGGGKWYANVIKSYKEKALGMFKYFMNCVEESNPGFKWNWREKDLVWLRFGATLQEEEYEKRDGSIGTRLVVKDIKTVKQIIDGDFKIPATKKLERTGAPAVTGSAMFDDDLDLPFK